MKTIALVGNPNVGKTTLFNLLTGSKQKVGNWAGVTVDKKEGSYKNNRIIDLPGIYALDTFSNEEKVSKEFLQKDDVDLIINIVDASNLVRNLFLTTQLKQFKKPIVIVLNMMDMAKSKGIEINTTKLEDELGLKVIPISASKNEGIDKVKDFIISGNFKKENNIKDFDDETDTYIYLDSVLDKCTNYIKTDESSISDKIDKVMLNKFLSFPIFLFMMFIIFKFTFNWAGQPLADLLDGYLNDSLIPFLNESLTFLSPMIKSLLVDGIISGVGSILVFLPIILVLFIGITLLEDSGYMARAALITDKLMRMMGLSGKAFIPMIVGFGCSVPAVMSARTLESEKDRKLAALLVPLMSCNARLPVYAVFISAFFPNNGTLVLMSLYLLGIVLSFLIGILFKNTIFKKDEEPFIIELPEYQVPNFKNLLLHTWEKAKGFVKKAGTIILAMSVVIWFLSSFSMTGATDSINDSFLASIGKAIAPFFAPLGFGNWQSAVALLNGLLAKEVVVSSMGVIFGSDLQTLLPQHFSAVTAYGFMVFVLLYTPCVTVIATMKKEFGYRFMLFSVGYQLALAWIVAFLVNVFGGMLANGAISAIQLLMAIALISLTIGIIIKIFKKKKSCDCSC
ncbi:ferrous iron transport protein B [Oceanirhabdus seepicola]|uniref:Ferrous iron transport protein B n=1 Tax=Oceanirhabdus seepicola TaxID=2828781 RepID=A0A9J6P2D9_9CLOT|nr:ferrous iron transport protein B [Oceanirhabdus seepicola]MCM1990564.1 ferrous iron transport protein B [Oceanirhabdus seepicola]